MRLRVVATAMVALTSAACSSDTASDATASTETAAVVTLDQPVFEPSPTVAPVDADSTSPSRTSTTTSTSTSTSTTTTVAPDVAVHEPDVCSTTSSPIWDVRPPSPLAAPVLTPEWVEETIGTSALGRPVAALHRPSDAPSRTVVVVGGIHGNEPVSPPTVRSFVAADIPDDVDLWLVPEMNPDGVAAGTRCNANGVDLNRNFTWSWRPDTGGPGPLSETEPTAVAALVDRISPDVVVWVHQPYGYIASIGSTPDAYAVAWAEASGVPVRSDVTQHGGGESWTAFVADRPSMLIEIPSWEATEEITAAHRAGFEALLAVVVPA